MDAESPHDLDESNPVREHPLQCGLLYLSLLAICLAPFFYGSYPQWVAGFAVAVFCALGISHIALSSILGTSWFSVPRYVALPAYLLLGWLSFTVIRDAALGPGADRFPALSVRTLPFAFAYFAAGSLGASCGTPKRLKTLLAALTVIGVVLGIFALVQWFGWDVKNFTWHAVSRPSGIYINPNRFAVTEALCVSCGLALFLAELNATRGLLESGTWNQNGWQSRGLDTRRLLRQALLVAALVIMGGSLALTLSRLTILAFGIGLGIAAFFWTRFASRRAVYSGTGESFRDLPLTERIQRIAFWTLPAIIMLGWGVWAFSLGNQTLTERFSTINASDSRLAVMKAAWPLFDSTQAKLFGHGLGSFAAVFTAVQPATLTERWSQLHSDWMQLAVEAGIPALVLAALLTAAWCVCWWRKASKLESAKALFRTPDSASGSIFMLAPLAGIFTVLICSGADFPLRETGSALAFFYLAGALVRSHTASSSSRSLRVLRAGLAFVLIVALGWSAWIAGRNALACASSPWRGRYLLPVETGTDPAAWERATTLDPDEPELHFLLALAADNAINAPPDVLENGLEHCRIGAALSPRDYHFPWVAALLSEKLHRDDDAAAYLDRTVSLFPENLELRMNAGLYYLRRKVKGRNPDDSQRIAAIEKALYYFKLVVKRDPSYSSRIADWMDESGCTSSEVTALWEGTGAASCLARARYFADRELWDFAGRALIPVDPSALPAGKREAIWYHALLGAVEFYQTRDDAGIAQWGKAVALGVVRNEPEAYNWIAERAQHLSPESTERLALALADRLKEAPALVNILGTALRASGKDFSAFTLLSKTAGNTDYLCALFADAALEIGDILTAEQQARKVLRYKSEGRNWVPWQENFDRKLDERRKRDKQK